MNENMAVPHEVCSQCGRTIDLEEDDFIEEDGEIFCCKYCKIKWQSEVDYEED